KSNDGRPTKIEGNSLHPDSNGGTDRFAQASILNLYDPDRAIPIRNGGNPSTMAAVVDFLERLSKEAQGKGGQGLSFLLERSNSPSRDRLQQQLSQKLPQAKWYIHEAIDLDVPRQAASTAFGNSVRPDNHFDAAKVIVSLDCDFIGSEEDAPTNIQRFAKGRKIESPSDTPSRLYVAEGLMTLTGFNADHRLRIATSAVAQLAAALAAELGVAGAGEIPKPAGVDS